MCSTAESVCPDPVASIVWLIARNFAGRSRSPETCVFDGPAKGTWDLYQQQQQQVYYTAADDP